MFKNQMHVQEYVYDFAVDGGAVGAIDLSAKAGMNLIPTGAVVQHVGAKVITACTSGGSATVAWGPSADADGYSGAAKAVASLTANAAFNEAMGAGALLWDDTNDAALYQVVTGSTYADFKMTIGTAALTAGKIAFWVEYFMPNS
jgi:hypothetical protein